MAQVVLQAEEWMHDGSVATARRASAASEGGTNLSAIRSTSSPPEQSSASAKAAASRIRRRNRLITSCLECRRRKLKCDKTSPCTNCKRFSRETSCLYLAPALDAHSQQKLADIKEKMGALEKNLEREVASRTTKQHIGGTNVTRLAPGDRDEDVDYDDDEDDLAEDEEVLEPTPLVGIDSVYADDGDDELMDLGVQMGKMRISERIGGWIRPKLVDELNDTLQDVQASKSRWSTGPQILDARKDHVKLQASPKSYIGPGPDYISPTPSWFPGSHMNPNLMDYLPSKAACDQLVAQYWVAVHSMCKTVHRPSFEVQNNHFWSAITTGNEPIPALQALVLSVMFSAAVSMTEDQIAHRFRTSRSALIDTLRSGTEMALSKANLLRTTKVAVMQAFVIYLIPLVRAEISRAHSALLGTAIRLAECMGLHRDGTFYNMTPIEVHVRRMIWHQLCFLDQRTCEATGPRPQIRREDYDTKFPLNVDDNDLIGLNAPTEDADRWTEMTIMRIRAECTEVRRSNWFDMIALDKKKKSLTSVLVKIQKFRQALESRYLPMLDDSIPFHVECRHIIALNINGMFIQVLHRYLFSTTTRMPDRLRQILIECGVAQMENAISLETNADLAPWRWYKGAFNQYHSALLLMVEVYAYPMRKDAQRIWKCLDYIFDIPPHLSPKQKAELVITDLRDRMEIFHQMRQVKATTQMEERVLGLMSKSSLRDSNRSPRGSSSQPGPSIDIAATSMHNMPPNGYSSPPPPQPASPAAGSRHGSTAATGDTPMMMDEIDWVSVTAARSFVSILTTILQNEWDKWFSPETNTGDLNIPNFDFAQFNGGFDGPPMMNPPPAMAPGLPDAGDLANVSMTPALFPTPSYMPWHTQQRQQ